MTRFSLALMLMTSAAACDLSELDGAGPDGGLEISSTSDELIFSPLCDPSFILPKLRMVSRTSWSITVEIDTARPGCRAFLDYYDLDYLGGPIFPKPPEWQLAFGPGIELPVQVTHTGRLPDTEYCYFGKAIEGGWARGTSACYRTETLGMKWW